MNALIENATSINFIRIISTTFNARLISQAFFVIFDNGGGNLERDFCSARAFEMLSA